MVKSLIQEIPNNLEVAKRHESAVFLLLFLIQTLEEKLVYYSWAQLSTFLLLIISNEPRCHWGSLCPQRYQWFWLSALGFNDQDKCRALSLTLNMSDTVIRTESYSSSVFLSHVKGNMKANGPMKVGGYLVSKKLDSFYHSDLPHCFHFQSHFLLPDSCY